MLSITPDTVFRKTAKGLVELHGKRTLAAELNVIFLAVDGRATVDDLLVCCGLSPDEVHRSLETLAKDGYIEPAQRRAEQAFRPDEQAGLDFTSGTPDDVDAIAEAPEPEIDRAERVRQLNARVDAGRRARETHEREAHGEFPTELPPAGRAPTVAANDPPDSPDPRGAAEYVPSALERAMAKLSHEPPQSRTARAEAQNDPVVQGARSPQRIDRDLERVARLESSLAERARRENVVDEAAARHAEAAELRRAADSAHHARAQEDAQRRKELARASRRKRLRWTLVLMLIGIPAAAVVLLQFVPLNRYRTRAETALSIRVGEPVKVGTVRYVLLPTPRVVLEKLTLARRTGITAERLEAPALPWRALNGMMRVELAKLSGIELDGPALAGIADWAGARPGAAIEVDRLRLERARLTLPQTELAPFDGDIEFDTDGSVKEAVLTNPKAVVELTALPKGVRVLVTARDWRIPYGPPVEFSELTIRGHIDGRTRGIAEFTGKAAGGVVDGVVNADWASDVVVDGRFRVENARIHDLAPAFTSSFAPRGILQASGRYDMKAPTLPALRASSRVDATFSLARGELTNIDLVRALQSPRTGTLRGGRTPFDKLTGAVQSARSQYTYRDLKLVSGPLNASGSVSVTPNGDLSGRVNAELASKGGVVARSVLTLGGTIQDPRLRR
jgi:hypothetical protein